MGGFPEKGWRQAIKCGGWDRPDPAAETETAGARGGAGASTNRWLQR